ncbi:MAG: sigma-54-dependent Fis family transcriptional regulator [Candidatus Lindowbacteria bacterium]|nr:sigma-54-dependent Fis family transcriptional regulator [Candidatus Lindowbacteria bacterium]
MDILIAEDDRDMSTSLVELLEVRGHRITSVEDGLAAIKLLDGADLLITDVHMSGMDGIALLRETKKRFPQLPVIVITGYSSVPAAVEVMNQGARTYLEKPFSWEEIIFHIRQIEQVVELRNAFKSSGRGALVGSSKAMQKVYREIDMAALSDAPVLICGETGTGKELTARAIHTISNRRSEPFIPVNLGAIPAELAESELFGFERGAFTGAHKKRRGFFTLASNGSLLLDEIDSLSPALQAKLLRAIETNEIWPLGEEKPHKLNVRIIAATNSKIEEIITSKEFRSDLYYRINVLRIDLPPLRNRIEDIPILIRVLLDRMRPLSAVKKQKGRFDLTEPEPLEISTEATEYLTERRWHGNVRELANVLERARNWASLGKEGTTRIELEHVDELQPAAVPKLPFLAARDRIIREWTIRTVKSAIVRSQGNVTHAAKYLGMNKGSLFRIIKKYQINSC